MDALLLLAEAPFPYAGELAAALSALLWASAGIVFARIHPPISAAAINLGKNVTACICFGALLWIVSGSPIPLDIPREPLLWFIGSGLIGLAVCDTFILSSLLEIGPQRMSLIFTLAPVLVALGALCPPFNEFPALLGWVGMAVCLAGIVMAVLEKPDSLRPGASFGRGVRNAVIGAVCQAAAILMARHGLQLADVEARDGATVRMLAGTLGLMLIGVPGWRVMTWGREMTRRHAGVLIFVAAFFGTFLGIWTNQLALEWATHTGVASVLNSLMPVYLIPLSAIFLGARITRRGVIATLIALAGIAMMTF